MKWANCKECGRTYQYNGDHMINEFCSEECAEKYEKRKTDIVSRF